MNRPLILEKVKSRTVKAREWWWMTSVVSGGLSSGCGLLPHQVTLGKLLSRCKGVWKRPSTLLESGPVEAKVFVWFPGSLPRPRQVPCV